MKKMNHLLALALAAALVMTNALPAFADEGEGDTNPPRLNR